MKRAAQIPFVFLFLTGILPALSFGQEVTRANIHYKKLKVILDGLYSQSFTDNVALTPTDEEAGARTNLKAMTGLLFPIKQSETNINFFGNLVLNGDPIYDIKSFSFLVLEKVKLGPYVNVVSNGSLTRALSYNPISDTLPIDILSGKFNCIAAFKTKVRLSFVSTYSLTNEENYNGEDYQEHATLNSIFFNITPKTALLVCYNYTRGYYFSPISANDNTTNTHYGRTGIRFAKILKRLDGQLGAGIRYARSRQHKVPDTEPGGPGFNVRVGSYPVFVDIEGKVNATFPKVKLGWDVTCGIRPTFGTNRVYAYAEETPEATESLVYLTNPFVSVLGSQVSGLWNIVSNFVISASLTGENRNFPVGQRRDTFIKQSYSMEWWNIRKYFQVGIWYSRSNNSSNTTRYTYVINEPGLKLTAKF